MKKKQFMFFLSVLLAALVLIVFFNYYPWDTKKFKKQDNYKEKQKSINGKILVFCSDPWPPFANNINDTEEGYLVELVRKIYEPLGYNVIYINKPWARCIEEAENGTVDSALSASPNEAPGLIYPKTAAANQRSSFFTLNDSKWTYKDINSLKNIKLGIIKDYMYDDRIFEYIKKMSGSNKIFEVTGNDGLRRLIEALFQKRVDVIVENREVMYYTLAKMGVDEKAVRFAGFASENAPLYVPFSPKRKDSGYLAQEFDKGFKKLSENGEVDKLMNKYNILKDEK